MGWGDGPSPGTVYGPGQPEHGGEQARLCLGRAKFTVLWAGQRAAGCMDIYNDEQGTLQLLPEAGLISL